MEEEVISTKISGGGKLLASYLIAWFIVLLVGRKIYTAYREKLSKDRKLRWFGGEHPEKDAYERALADMPEGDDDASAREYEEKLRKLLLRRAMTDFKRVLQLNGEKESVFNLMREGAVGEDMWADFKAAESDMQVEIFDLQAEAETFKPGTRD